MSSRERVEGEGTEPQVWGPVEIRALRGELTRAAFALSLGVTPVTVYRWELPDDAPEARRPRGALIERLRQLASGTAAPPLVQVAPPLPVHAAPPPPMHAPQPPPVVVEHAASHSAPSFEFEEEQALVLPVLDAIQTSDWRRAESELLALLMARRLVSPAGRALAAVGLAHVHLGYRGDPRSAFSSLHQALSDAEAGILPASVEVQVHAAAANVFASFDGRLLDVGRVHAHTRRVAALGGVTPELRALAWLADQSAAFAASDQDLIASVFARGDELLESSLPPLLRGRVEESRAVGALLGGKPSLALRLLEELARRASDTGQTLLEARALAFIAMRKLDDLAPPEVVLELARRSGELASQARLPHGLHTFIAAAAETEALVRLGKFAEAERVFAATDAIYDELGLPPIHTYAARAHLCFLTGRHDSLRAVAARMCENTLAATRAQALAVGAYLRAYAELTSATDPARMKVAFDEAEEAAAPWPALRLSLLVRRIPSYFRDAGQLGEVQAALRNAQRMLDLYPSPFQTAVVRTYEGLLLGFEGQWVEARRVLEAAIGTFERAGDRPEAALARIGLARLARAYRSEDATQLMEASEKEFARLELPLPAIVFFGNASAKRERPDPFPVSTPVLGELVAPLARLSVRGVGANFIQGELVTVVREMFPTRAVSLEELDGTGKPTLIGGDHGRDEARTHFVEFGNGAGRRFRLGVEGLLSSEARAALSVVGMMSGLVMEVAILRGFAEQRADPGAAEPADPEVPGLVVASSAMRQLRAELARLGASRVTVIITGESGVGKDVIARSLHGLSARAGKPFMALNCAAVPRDLFEAQLFGYRKGAFTGAASDSPGVVRAAAGGTLFLDEVGELPLDIQPKILRFLENGEVLPLGERAVLKVDVRLVAATNRDLAQLVREGKFRQDLYYRLQVVPLHVPPLRERREDIVALARHFVRSLTPEGKEPPVLAPDALATLAKHDWPGNVRELRNVIERALAFAPFPRVLTAQQLRFV